MALALSDSGNHLYKQDRDLFLRALFVPPEPREALMVFYTLKHELALIYDKVREEMIGHIRYAWWQERLEALYDGTAPKGHPLLEALFVHVQQGNMPKEVVVRLVEAHREHFPNRPLEEEVSLTSLSVRLLEHISSSAIEPWRRADAIIKTHRHRYGEQGNVWLNAKLWFASIF